MDAPIPSPAALPNFQFATIGKPPPPPSPPSLLSRLAEADPNISLDPDVDPPPSPPPPAAASPELSTASLGRLAVLLPSNGGEPSHASSNPNIHPSGRQISAASQEPSSMPSTSRPKLDMYSLNPNEFASLLWQANNSVPSVAPTLASATPTSFYSRGSPTFAPVAGPSSLAVPTSATIPQPRKPSVPPETTKPPLSQPADKMQVDAPSRPPEPPAPRSSSVSSVPSASSEALRLSEELRDAKIELDDVRRTRERVVDEYKEFHHRYQETLHALEREKAQMERLVAVTEEWFGKAEKMVERREQQLSEDHTLCAKRVQEEEDRERERAESEERTRFAAEEAKRLEDEERAKAAAARASAEAKEKAIVEVEKKARLEAERKARAEAAERARVEAVEKARAEAEERARTEAAENAKLIAEAEDRARVEAEQREILAKAQESKDRQRAEAITQERLCSTPVPKQSDTTSPIAGKAAVTHPLSRQASIGGLALTVVDSDAVSNVPTIRLGEQASAVQPMSTSSMHVPLSLGQPSIEVRPVSGSSAPPTPRGQSSIRQVQQSPTPSFSNPRVGVAPAMPARTVPAIPNVNKEEQLKPELLKKKARTPPESARSAPPPVSVAPASHTQQPSDIATSSTTAAPKARAPAHPPAPPATSTASNKVTKASKAAKKRVGGPSPMIKPEPSPSPTLPSPVVPPQLQAAFPPATAAPNPPYVQATHALPLKPTKGPPPPSNAKTKPAKQNQAKERVRVSTDGDRSVRAPAPSNSQNRPASQDSSQGSRRSSMQGELSTAPQARLPPVPPARSNPAPARAGYVHNNYSLPLYEDEPWDVGVRESFGPTDEQLELPLEERPRWDHYSPSPARQSPHDDRFSPLSNSLSPVRGPSSPTRKRFREDDRDRDIAPPPPRRPRYSDSSNEVSPRQRRAPLPDVDRGRGWDRAMTPPYPPAYHSPPPLRTEPGPYSRSTRLPGSRSPPPSSYPPPPLRDIRQLPAASRPMDDYRRAEPPVPRIANSYRPQRPVTPPLPPAPSPRPSGLMHRLSAVVAPELLSRDHAPMDLLSRMSDARPSVSKSRPNRAELPTETVRPNRSEGAQGKRGEGKRGRSDKYAAKTFPVSGAAQKAHATGRGLLDRLEL